MSSAATPVTQLIERARRVHRQGDLVQAEALYRSVLTANPANPEALYLLGIVLFRQGQGQKALALLNQVVERHPDHLQARGSLGQVLHERGDYEGALTHFAYAFRKAPSDSRFLNSYGLALAACGRHNEAINLYSGSLNINPGNKEIQTNLGNLYRQCQDFDNAKRCYLGALKIDRSFPEALNNLGVLLLQTLRYGEAKNRLQQAIDARPEYAEAWCNYGTVLSKLKKPGRALKALRKAIDLQPGFSEAWISCGMICQVSGLHSQARYCFDQVLKIAPQSTLGQVGRCMAELEMVYKSADHVGRARSRYQKRLEHLVSSPPKTMPGDSGVTENIIAGSLQPFLLAYQGENDRALQQMYGHWASAREPKITAIRTHHPHTRPRVGIVSGFFYDHSNWNIPVRGWLRHLSKEFDVYAFYTGNEQDWCTREAASLCVSLVSQRSYHEFAEAIVEAEIDVLIYPEIGMDPLTAQLATQRLARIQCVSWGHPSTSGYPEIDYFLSSALMEPDNAESFYTEQLITLPGISCEYQPPKFRKVTGGRELFGLSDEEVVFLCVQNIAKYRPQDDWMLAQIVAGVNHARLVFIDSCPPATGVFKTRLAMALEAEGRHIDQHTLFLPRQDRDRYHRLNELADVFLDTPGWSGCNSSLQALDCGLPVVTLPGHCMRGRHTLAFYRQMEMLDLVVADERDYIFLATRLGNDAELCRFYRQRIEAGRTELYGDDRSEKALVRFIRDVTQ